MSFLNSTLLLILTVFVNSQSLASEPINHIPLRVRIISNSNCEECDKLRDAFLEDNSISGSSKNYYYSGLVTILVNGKKEKAYFEFINTESPYFKKLKFSKPVDINSDFATPYLQTLKGSEIVSEGKLKNVAGDMNVMYQKDHEAWALITTVGAIQESVEGSKSLKSNRSLSGSYKAPERLISNSRNDLSTLSCPSNPRTKGPRI